MYHLSNFALKSILSIQFILTAPGSRKTSPQTTIWPNLSMKGLWIDVEKSAGIPNEFENLLFYYDLYHQLRQ